MKRSPIKRKSATKKRRPPGVGCQQKGRKTCRRDAVTTVDETRLCAVHAADRLFAEAVRGESGDPCWAWGQRFECSDDRQCCHIRSRRYLSLRWSDVNARPLCAAHHHWFTLRPADWEQFCRDQNIDWDELRYRALNYEPMDPLAVIARYQEAA